MVLAEALDLVGDSVVTVDVDGRIKSWNLAAAALYGVKPNDALNQDIEPLIGTYPEEAKLQLQTRGSWTGRLERKRADGSTIRVRARLARFSTAASDVDRTIDVSTLIDETHPAEKKLQDIEYRYRNLFGAVAASFWELDFVAVGEMLRDLRETGVADLRSYFAQNPKYVRDMMRATRIIDMNDRSMQLFEGSKRDLLNSSIDQFWPYESTKDFASSVLAAIGGDPHFIVETRMQTLLGRVFDVLFTVTFLPGTVGTGTLLIGITDISDRVKASKDLQEANLRHRMFLEVSSVALSEMISPELAHCFEDLRATSVIDLSAYIDEHPEFIDFALANVRFGEANEAAVKLFGAISREDLIGRTLVDVFVPGRDVFRSALENVYKSNSAFQAEMRVRSLDGRQVDTIFCMVSPPELRKKGIVLAAHLDVTEQVNVRRDLERLRKGVAHSARVAMLGELSASIAHEISQPITAITTNASTLERVLQQKNLNLEIANGVSQRLQRDAMRVRDIIQRIRTLAANQEVQFEPVNLDTVVSDTITLLAHELQEHEVALTKSNRVSAPIVIGDRVQLQQVMVNLIMNAIQAMHACPPRNRRVQIELVEADHRLMICVTDSGVGFPDGAASEMFESFRSTKQGGLGMGLAICRSIVEAHGGSLTAGNRLDEPGAVLRVSLPAAPSE